MRARQSPAPNRAPQRKPREAPEGLLLFVLVIALLVTVASLFWAHHPAATILLPLNEAQSATTR